MKPLLAASVLALALLPPALALPSFDAVRAAHAPSDIPLLARDGTPLQRVRVDAQARRGEWVRLADISPALRHALVLGEDRRFWQHGGVDWAALAASAWANAWNQRTRGASTLTMQLAALLDDELARPAGGRSVGDKLAQMARAQQLEARWSKTQILEASLNLVPLRGESVGVAAAAWQLFGKHASGLDAVESALLAAMVRAPNASAAQLERRGCELLRQQGVGAGCEALAFVLPRALERRPGPMAGEALAPHLARHLVRQQLSQQPHGAAPKALASTLDARVQRLAVAALRRQLAELRGRHVDDGAVVVLDNHSGEVLAWVGSAGIGASAPEVDAVLARRQPGSTIKPFVYALALQQRLITPATLLDDSPLQLDAGGAAYLPRNYDHAWRGPVPARQALAASLNVPAVRLAAMLGPDAVFGSLQAAGLRLAESAGFHGHALALGSADVTLLDLSNAYRLLARQGLWSPVRFSTTPDATAAPARRVFDEGVAFLVADMLADPAARAITFGLDSALVTRGWAAVKTGTSKDMRDNWCIGFSSRYTVGVWVGNAGGAPMQGVSGVSGAAPVWRELMLALHEGQPSAPPQRPGGLVAAQGEWFLPGTAPRHASQTPNMPNASIAQLGIRHPSDGSVIVLDPEIPPQAQRLRFEGAPGQWWLNGQPLGRGAGLSWLPRPGRHRLELRHAEGVDRVEFEVRAALPRPRVAQAAVRTP